MRAIPASEHACFDVELDSGLAVRTRSIMQTMLMRSVRGRFATLPCVGHHSLILITRHPSRTLGDTPSCLLHTNCQCSERLLDAEEAGPAYILNAPGCTAALHKLSRYHPSWSWTAEPPRRIDPSKFSAPHPDGRSFEPGSSCNPCGEKLADTTCLQLIRKLWYTPAPRALEPLMCGLGPKET